MTLAPCDINDEFPALFSIDKVSAVKAMTGDASSRKYYRLSTLSGQRFVMQVAEAFSGKNSFSYGREIFSLAGVLVPEIMACSPGKGWMILEDLGDVCYQGKLDSKNLSSVLAPLESLFEANLDELKLKLPEAPQWGWFFDFEKLFNEMLFFKKHFLEGFLSLKNVDLGFLENLCRQLDTSPKILCHRDYHTRNLMEHEGKCYVIDFQDARLGPASYDWVSILLDPYSPLPLGLRDEGLSQFLQLHKNLLNVTHQNSLKEFWSCGIQRMIKAVGSYASFKNLQGRDEYLTYIVPALTHGAEAFVKLKELGFVDSKYFDFERSIESWMTEVKKRVKL
ncbi:phosphotransferase [bacterium]|nr:phosphotransferase [bacterium]